MTLMETYAAQLEKARTETLAAFDAVPEAQRCAHFKEGTATPHWLLGHLSVAINGMVFQVILGKPGSLKAEELRPYLPDFLGGEVPTSDASAYEDWDILRQRYDTLMREAAAAIAVLHPAVLENPTSEKAPEMFRARFPLLRDCLHQIIMHDAYHRGQLALIVKYA